MGTIRSVEVRNDASAVLGDELWSGVHSPGRPLSPSPPPTKRKRTEIVDAGFFRNLKVHAGIGLSVVQRSGHVPAAIGAFPRQGSSDVAGWRTPHAGTHRRAGCQS